MDNYPCSMCLISYMLLHSFLLDIIDFSWSRRCDFDCYFCNLSYYKLIKNKVNFTKPYYLSQTITKSHFQATVSRNHTSLCTTFHKTTHLTTISRNHTSICITFHKTTLLSITINGNNWNWVRNRNIFFKKNIGKN